jgi:hypothetical protein
VVISQISVISGKVLMFLGAHCVLSGETAIGKLAIRQLQDVPGQEREYGALVESESAILY